MCSLKSETLYSQWEPLSNLHYNRSYFSASFLYVTLTANLTKNTDFDSQTNSIRNLTNSTAYLFTCASPAQQQRHADNSCGETSRRDAYCWVRSRRCHWLSRWWRLACASMGLCNNTLRSVTRKAPVLRMFSIVFAWVSALAYICLKQGSMISVLCITVLFVNEGH